MDDDYYDDEDEDADIFAASEARQKQEDAQRQRGVEDRAFFDDLAKKEDERHNAMRKDIAHRSLMLGELRQKMRHKDAELRAIKNEIDIERDRIDFETKKAYRRQANQPIDETGAPTSGPIPILTKDIPQSATGGEEFSVERATVHMKQREDEYAAKKAEADLLQKKIDDEARALSELQHSLLRM